MTALLKESVGREDVFNNLMDIGNIEREDGQSEPHKVLKVLAMGRRGNEPREFKD
jgi:hypothetical protein